ncbi:MAG: hypothetical protein M5U19_02615 [Microthrixaceae bacterium]|nr:hypothetical protein [Microthrixaceae bacterium]
MGHPHHSAPGGRARPVGRGGVFAHWCDTLPHHTLDTPRRFEHQWEAQASLALRPAGPKPQTRTSPAEDPQRHPATVRSRVAQAHPGRAQAGRTVAITTTNAETARAINREIQYLAHPGATGGVRLHDDTTVQARLHRDAGLEPPHPIAATRAALADLRRADAAMNAAESPTVVDPEPTPPIAPTAPLPTRPTGPSLGL